VQVLREVVVAPMVARVLAEQKQAAAPAGASASDGYAQAWRLFWLPTPHNLMPCAALVAPGASLLCSDG
jgi:hypothetical protein